MNYKSSFRILFAGLALLCSMLILSCTKSSHAEVNNTPDEIQSVSQNSNAASTYSSQQTWLMDETVFVPCANNGLGEQVKLNGYVHFNNQVTVNENRFTLITHTNPNEVSGVGLTTGDHYVASGGGILVYTGSIINGQAVAGGSTRFSFTGSGPGNNLTITFKAHVVVNANGEVVNQLQDGTNSCR